MQTRVQIWRCPLYQQEPLWVQNSWGQTRVQNLVRQESWAQQLPVRLMQRAHWGQCFPRTGLKSHLRSPHVTYGCAAASPETDTLYPAGKLLNTEDKQLRMASRVNRKRWEKISGERKGGREGCGRRQGEGRTRSKVGSCISASWKCSLKAVDVLIDNTAAPWERQPELPETRISLKQMSGVKTQGWWERNKIILP